MSLSKVSLAREALFAFRMLLPWLKVPVRWYQTMQASTDTDNTRAVQVI
jgi:hypothetical protein